MTEIKNEQLVGIDEELQSIFGADFRPSNSKQINRSVVQKGVLTIVNTKANGKRILIASDVIKKMGNPTQIHVALNDKGIVIGQSIAENYFQLKDAANKKVIYSSQLVKEITDAFNLDFSEKTCISYQNVSYVQYMGHTLASIDFNQD
ncbi:hypothetical protein P5G60_17270 [Paenibacillus jamilae]|nr:hypothetical protein [Paenibacillus jamilae]